ncbi:lipid II flippase Amj family protein [Mesobacillus zeae]|uniref:Lipid II flippase Amj n=1 Tax=Mesobacillus zeae TaxID=1917180 RepID=A0A398BGJ6_9BACI|nr:lipid II flippase Amj family protein [Mesobacillus zeae]RID88311.1 DUF2837 family protein [Mesobacillus zeae]
MDLFTDKLLIISFFLMTVTVIETLAYATRISGARVRLISTAVSLFSTMVIFSRMSVMFQQPLMGKLIVEAPNRDPLSFLQDQYRILIAVTTLGVLVGIIMFPTFISIFSRGIIELSEEKGSVLAVVRKWANLRGGRKVLAYIRLPRFADLRGITLQTIPKRLFVLNIVISAVYTTGVMSALYASLIVPEDYRQAAVLSSGIINGIATILLTLFIDPKVSVLADRVAKKESSYIYLKSYSVTMIGSKLAGTVAAQLVFLPAALYVAWFVMWI